MKLSRLCSKCGKELAAGVGLCALCGIFTPSDPLDLSARLDSANVPAIHQWHGTEDTYIEQQLRLQRETAAITTTPPFVPNTANMNLTGYRPELFIENPPRNELLHRSPKIVPDGKT